MSNPTLSNIIREEVRNAPSANYEAVVYKVLERITKQMQEDLLVPAVYRVVQDTVRQLRRENLVKAHNRVQQQTVKSPPKAAGQVKKQSAKAALKTRAEKIRDEEANNFFNNIWKETSTGPKRLGECTVEDLRFSRDNQRIRSDDLLIASARDEALAYGLEQSGCGTVREMGFDEAIASVFSPEVQTLELEGVS